MEKKARELLGDSYKAVYADFIKNSFIELNADALIDKIFEEDLKKTEECKQLLMIFDASLETSQIPPQNIFIADID